MPYLGWDPCPGDVGSVQHLARQYQLCASEVRSIGRQVTGVDLTGWLGRTGEAIVRQRAAIAAALASYAQLAGQTGQVTAEWARQLARFQAEVDVLEQRAKTAAQEQEFWQQRQAALKLGGAGPARYAELDAAQVQMQLVQQQAEQVHEDYENAATRLAGQLDPGSPTALDRVESARKILEGLLAPFDLAAGDHYLEALAELAETLEKWAGERNKGVKLVIEMRDKGLNRVSELIEGGYTLERMESDPALWGTVMRSLSEIQELGYTMTGLGIIADIGNIIEPEDPGARGQVDRGAALTNGTLLALNSTDWVPYWGEAVLIMTGVYLAADYTGNHYPLSREITAEIAGVSLSTDPQDNIGVAETTMQAVHDAEHAAEEAGHTLRDDANRAAWSVTCSLTSSLGRWF
jgi:hypothetical protein